MSSSEGEDNVPLAKRRATNDAVNGNGNVASDDPSKDTTNGVKAEKASDSEDDVPLNGRASRAKAKTPATNGSAKKRTATAAKANGTTTPKAKRAKKEESSETPKPKVKKETSTSSAKSKVKKETPSPAEKKKSKVKSESPGPSNNTGEEEDDEEEERKWWEDMGQEDDTQKWTTLEHNGVLFPPPYEPLPNSVRLIYDRKRVVLKPEAEEVAGFFGAMINTQHAENVVFQQNFFNDFLRVLEESGGAQTEDGKSIELTDFHKCDFTEIFNHYEKLRNQKKALSSIEKKKLKAERDAMEEKYKTCLIDGRREPVGNFRIEPPGLFRGRGKHPKTGKLKARVQPEQVIINIGKDAVVPEPPEGHEWAEVRHDNTVTWLANWKENINGNNKYVLLAASSSMKGKSDFKKFEKARELKKHVKRIRADYRKELDAQKTEHRQRATAMYLIDVLALRAGGEKGEDEADTVGCCSLRYEHVTLKPPNIVVFDFLGKDSIRYYQEVEVDKKVFRNLKIFKKNKTEGDDIFDRLDPSILNRHLQNYMPGLTAKVFRTYNATYTMEQQIDKIPNEGTVGEKVVAFNAANRTVAILCNHQRSVAKGHEASVGKIEDRLKELNWEKTRLKKKILQLDKGEKKKDPQYFEEIDTFTKEEIAEIQAKIIERDQIRAERKFQRENEKLEAEGEKVQGDDVWKERQAKVDEKAAAFKEELKSGNPALKNTDTVEKLKEQVKKLEDRITNTSLQLKDKEDNSTVALSTSKMNYIDPRITVMFSKKFEVPIEKLFTKTLREKFAWAIESADEKWRF
ncbi:hypothetical protein TRICI_005326 [Trichomonascus ciferrii]|uniref:DNA topoisomerase I n=1 Tax=Trichomonascus ciferrii TaxID=44093 RepID=A0A642UVX3_9ASCO|nr:hypothetical protein TRICI_005326 [Trichomonascus ciferrii]